jgi:hypothetical protein
MRGPEEGQLKVEDHGHRKTINLDVKPSDTIDNVKQNPRVSKYDWNQRNGRCFVKEEFLLQ